ncbi:MAG: right-handed parallel beta-helix repeat-containing protein [Rhodobacteraceae bacterium]|nr:right-handed parallel beta-helix repeat-containing protein [Paracoccaceae bacterium]
MNKAITDGIQLMPPAFEFGLTVWSSEDGTPGSATYDGAGNATLIAADADFGGCLELQKTSSTQKLRYTGETPMLVGCYWRVRVFVKAISGPLPSVRVAAWAGQAGGAHVAGVFETGSSVALTTYGEVVEITAIVGSGSRTGVDMPWGQVPTFGHFGIDLTGVNGGVVRIDDIIIEDVTSFFQGSKIDVVDVRDFGAIGDGVTDDKAAFEAADAAAAGRSVLVPEGIYFLGGTVTINSEIRFQGTVTMPDSAILQLIQNFDYPTYFTAFGNEQLGFEKALQAMFNFTDHVQLDLCGRSVELTRPVDVHTVVGNKNDFSNRRVICNGQLNSATSSDWNDTLVTATASYDPDNPNQLTGVNNINTIPVGALITGTGVGREVYVRSVNTSANTITLSRELWGAPASQTYSFTRFKYQLDFSGFTSLKRFVIDNLNFSCGGKCSGLMLADEGLIFHVKDCYFSAPKDRGLTSAGTGCSGILLDRNQWLSNEQQLGVDDRKSIGFNINASDPKIRDNRAIRFKHWGVISGRGGIITGNHFFQEDSAGGTARSAGLVFAHNHPKTSFFGNYVDNCFIEWTNEHDATPDIVSGFSFGGLSFTGNHFTSSGAASWFTWIQIKPHGTGHFINGLSIIGNVFKAFSGPELDRVEELDTSIATMRLDKYRNITVEGNTFTNVQNPFINPVHMVATESSPSNSWRTDAAKYMPFKGHARNMTAAVPIGAIKNASNVKVYTQPYFEGSKGTNGSEFDLKWSEAVKGSVRCVLRCDDNI